MADSGFAGPASAPISAYCVKCGSPVTRDAQFCPKCGQAQGAVASTKELSLFDLQGVYNMGFDHARVPESQLARFRKHQFFETFPSAVAVLLHFLTIGIFTVIFHGMKHSRLPIIRADDFGAGKAIGFLFIPFFNLYWIFVFWHRLTDRINLQYRLRGAPDPISRGLVTTTCVLTVIPYIGLIAFLGLYPVVSAQIQSACNGLAEMNARQNH